MNKKCITDWNTGKFIGFQRSFNENLVFKWVSFVPENEFENQVFERKPNFSRKPTSVNIALMNPTKTIP